VNDLHRTEFDQDGDKKVSAEREYKADIRPLNERSEEYSEGLLDGFDAGWDRCYEDYKIKEQEAMQPRYYLTRQEVRDEETGELTHVHLQMNHTDGSPEANELAEAEVYFLRWWDEPEPQPISKEDFVLSTEEHCATGHA